MNLGYIKNKKIPDSPGVYIFRDYKKRPIYIGRATSLQDRTKSYFANDLIETRGPRIVDMITKAKYITWQVTTNVLEAILLESQLIKRYQPIYNVDERDDKSDQYIVITEEEWPRVFLVRVRDYEKMKTLGTLPYSAQKTFGPFSESQTIKEAMRILRKIFPYRDFKSVDPRHERFYSTIGRSPDLGKVHNKEYLKTIKYLTLFFENKVNNLKSKLEREMNKFAKEKKFEQAEQNKKLLYALNHINDITLIKNQKETIYQNKFRIEAFDIAHLSGKDVVGTMVVMENGFFNKAEYRKFKISIEQNNDLANLKELMTRRFNHSEWTFPDLVVVDGDERQYDIAQKVLQARRFDLPVVAVKKNAEHKASEFIGNPDLTKKYQKEIIAINAEAHRFSISYHRKLRDKSFGIV